MSQPRPCRSRGLLWFAVAVVLTGLVVIEVIATAPTREAVHTYAELIAAANRQDREAIRRLCTDRYVASHEPTAAAEGGIIGLPRNIHKNFQVWRQGGEVWLCPTNRHGPVYRFAKVEARWRFDGVVGQLRPDGRMELLAEDRAP